MRFACLALFTLFISSTAFAADPYLDRGTGAMAKVDRVLERHPVPPAIGVLGSMVSAGAFRYAARAPGVLGASGKLLAVSVSGAGGYMGAKSAIAADKVYNQGRAYAGVLNSLEAEERESAELPIRVAIPAE